MHFCKNKGFPDRLKLPKPTTTSSFEDFAFYKPYKDYVSSNPKLSIQ